MWEVYVYMFVNKNLFINTYIIFAAISLKPLIFSDFQEIDNYCIMTSKHFSTRFPLKLRRKFIIRRFA